MPYRATWFPASVDKSLIVHPERLAKPCYHCRYCGGWIEGHPNQYEENSLGPLSGRKGTASHCRRCGQEIAFFGMMS